MFIPISKGCEILGVSLATVYQMLKRGVLKEYFRTEGEHRRFNVHGKRSHKNRLKLVSI